MNNGYVIALFQVLMGFGLIWLIRSTYQLVGYLRHRASTGNEPVSTRKHPFEFFPQKHSEIGKLMGSSCTSEH